MVLISLLMDGKSDIVPNLLGGALFGTLMSFLFVSVQKESLKGVGVEEWTDKNLQTHQQNRLSTSLSPEELMTKIQAVDWIKEIKQVSSNKLVIRTRSTLSSWGEIVEAVWDASFEKERSIQVSSRSVLSWVPFDGGKNLKNLLLFEALINT